MKSFISQPWQILLVDWVFAYYLIKKIKQWFPLKFCITSKYIVWRMNSSNFIQRFRNQTITVKCTVFKARKSIFRRRMPPKYLTHAIVWTPKWQLLCTMRTYCSKYIWCKGEITRIPIKKQTKVKNS